MSFDTLLKTGGRKMVRILGQDDAKYRSEMEIPKFTKSLTKSCFSTISQILGLPKHIKIEANLGNSLAWKEQKLGSKDFI